MIRVSNIICKVSTGQPLIENNKTNIVTYIIMDKKTNTQTFLLQILTLKRHASNNGIYLGSKNK